MTRSRQTFAATKLAIAAIAAIAVSACKGDDGGDATAESTETPGPGPTCQAEADAPDPLPGVRAEHLTLEYWLDRLGEAHDLDRALLTPEQIDNFNAGIEEPREGYHSQRDLLAPIDLAELKGQVDDRRTWARDKLREGKYLDRDGQKVAESELAIYDAEVALDGAQPELKVALTEVPIRCSPRPEPFHSESLDLRFDRNACSTIRPQEVVQVIAQWPNGMWLVRTRYAFGWIADASPLSPAIPRKLHETLVSAPRLQLMRELAVESAAGSPLTVAAGTVLPAVRGKKRRVYVASASGFEKSGELAKGAVRSTRRNLTRRAVLQELWRYAGTPFGLGGVGGGRDCSRMLMDTFETFGLRLPRHSKWQSLAGSFWIDVEKDLPESERLLLIDAAAKKGLVLLHFPDHIMFYLGRDRQGTPMVYHAFAEYLEPCNAGAPTVEIAAETVVKVENVTVSNLELGRGTSRTAFIERLSRITVIGGSPGLGLMGVADMRPAAPTAKPRRCRDSQSAAIFFSPERAHRGAPLRVIAATSRDPGPAALSLIAPSGTVHRPEPVHLGGPPFGRVVSIDQPEPGRWTAILGDGDEILACDRVRVRSHQPGLRKEDPAGPVWRPRRRWGVATENLYSMFVERLLDYPITEDRVWPNLHSLTRDRDHNILYNHRGLDEDEELALQPDCADLPYTLRAYFAWKMRLPFGYRRCKRARSGRPPECDEPGDDDNLISRLELGKTKVPQLQERGDLDAFALFLQTKVLRAVHSSSGRTRHDDEESDLYPVPLTREALRPGTVFIDPYGHVLTIADWIPQGAGDKYGILVGVDAQPDGTVGRRRFWRGSFLFDPDTRAGAAGFKAFRPRVYSAEPLEVLLDLDGRDEEVAVNRIGYAEELDNDTLRRTRKFPRLSFEQYRGSKDDFYDTIESLVNPRPLDPVAMQMSLVDALDEAVRRRLNSVDNGEKYMAEHVGEVMEMPEGARIFLASDPWESFSTPSRDLRLLISIDSVVGFPDVVARAPQRFGQKPGPGAEQLVTRVRAALDQALAKRSFSYTRSDGSQYTVTLADLVARQKGLEMAYNPNDCPEVRWGAAEGSQEMAPCQRRAPEEQRARMDSYRSWFATRQRPPN